MKFRLLCFGSHLLVSAVIALLSVGMVFWVWYPSPLDKALGVAEIFILLLCIDVIIGPLLTLIVAKQGKATLKTDLSIIVFLQVAALAYGLNIVGQGRPVWLVYDNNRFQVVQAYEAISANGEYPIAAESLVGPVWAAVVDSARSGNHQEELFLRQEFLSDYKVIQKTAGNNAIPLDVLNRFNDSARVGELRLQYPAADAYIPIVAKEKNMIVLVNKSVGEPLAIVDINPW